MAFNYVSFKDNDFSNKVFSAYLETTIHELLHIIVFDPELFKNFLDPATGAKYTTEIYDATNGLIKSPKVIQAAKDYFGCATITGMPLEN
jgi:hypothetical protein